jgi:hypothetical protein
MELNDRPAHREPRALCGLIEHEGRWLWVGKTPWDRLLIIVFTVQGLPLYRLIPSSDAKKWVEESATMTLITKHTRARRRPIRPKQP